MARLTTIASVAPIMILEEPFISLSLSLSMCVCVCVCVCVKRGVRGSKRGAVIKGRVRSFSFLAGNSTLPSTRIAGRNRGHWAWEI
jgi:hypothetical protein